MVKKALVTLYERDLERLKNEILAYNDERYLWQVADGINNSGGNLCLHICGNLQHFVGTGIGKTDYVRERDAEFSLKNVPVNELITLINQTKKVVCEVILALSDEDLEADIPDSLFRDPMSVVAFLLHLETHLNYHLGQINYHRRLLS